MSSNITTLSIGGGGTRVSKTTLEGDDVLGKYGYSLPDSPNKFFKQDSVTPGRLGQETSTKVSPTTSSTPSQTTTSTSPSTRPYIWKYQ